MGNLKSVFTTEKFQKAKVRAERDVQAHVFTYGVCECLGMCLFMCGKEKERERNKYMQVCVGYHETNSI